MKNFIIVEGCDNTGKTTTIKRMLEHYKDLNFAESYSPLPPKDKNDYSKFLLKRVRNFVRNDFKDLILDRFFFSEMVYGPIMRSKLMIDEKAQFILFEYIKLIDPLIILCSPPLEKVYETFHEREQYPAFNQIKAIHSAYEAIFNHKYSQIIKYDYTTQYDDLFNLVDEALKSRFKEEIK